VKKWEYLTIQITGKVPRAKYFSEYGAEGWELVQVIEAYPTLTGKADKPTRYYIFKRPIED
jgi:hypothetical protein